MWLAQGDLTRISATAQGILQQADLLISPMVLIEVEYLYETHRLKLPSRDVQFKIGHELGVRVCDLSFPLVASVATGETWTGDPFDRLIVAQAKANGLAPLISADEEMAQRYPRTVW